MGTSVVTRLPSPVVDEPVALVVDDPPSAEEVTDAELVARARERDTFAWAELYTRHLDAVFARVYYLVGDAEVSRDLTQDTFARAVISLHRFRGDSGFRHWLYRIALNVVREQRRRCRSGQRLCEKLAELSPEDHGDPTADPEAKHLDAVRTEILHAVLQELPDSQREAFVLRDIEGLSTREAAEQLGVSVTNLAVRAHRARHAIRFALVRLGWLSDNDLEGTS